MTRIAVMMINQCWTVVALFLVAPLLLGSVAGEVDATTTEAAKFDEEVPMITLNQTVESFRPRERRLATATVWCVSVPNTSDATLQTSLDWACGPLSTQGQVNCGPVNVGGACYDPDTVAHHSDWAFNAYFLRMNGTAEACNFAGTAEQVTIDPSSGTCTFQGSNVTLNSTTPSPSPPVNSSAPPPPPPPPGSAGSPLYSHAAPEAWQHYHLFRFSTIAILVTYLFT